MNGIQVLRHYAQLAVLAMVWQQPAIAQQLVVPELDCTFHNEHFRPIGQATLVITKDAKERVVEFKVSDTWSMFVRPGWRFFTRYTQESDRTTKEKIIFSEASANISTFAHFELSADGLFRLIVVDKGYVLQNFSGTCVNSRKVF